MSGKEQEPSAPSLNQKKRKPKKPLTVKAVLIDLVKLYFFYVGLSLAIAFLFRDCMTLFPSADLSWKSQLKNMASMFHTKIEEPVLKARDGKKLSALFMKNADSEKLALVSHGNAGNIGDRLIVAANLLAAGCSVLLYDYRGYGESGGEAHLTNLIDDGLSAYDYAKNDLGYKDADIILYGESIGCGVTSGVMTRRHPGALILQSPFTSFLKAARDRLFFLACLPDSFMPEPKLDNLSAFQKPHPPLLLIHGDSDATLPCRYSKEIFENAQEPKQLFIVPGAGHNDVYANPNNGVLLRLRQFVKGLQ